MLTQAQAAEASATQASDDAVALLGDAVSIDNAVQSTMANLLTTSAMEQRVRLLVNEVS